MNPDELLELIKTRRSYRTFEDKQINDQQLDMILEAGLYAPNAGGRQSILFLVTQDKQINEQLGKISRQVAHVVKGRYVSKEQPSIIDNPDIKSALYGAPTVITLLGPKDFIFNTKKYRAFYHIIVGYPKGKTAIKERKSRIYKY